MKREIKFRAFREFPKYEVGDDGSVWSLDYNHTGERGILKQNRDKDGYAYVFLVVNNKRYKRSVHRMVANSFINNPEGKPQVNHKNGVRDDNVVENLEWCTAKENTVHGFRVNGRKISDRMKERAKKQFTGINNPKAKMTTKLVNEMRHMRATGSKLKDISTAFGMSIAQVGQICNNKFWKNAV
jgi:hypothetical protein